MAYLDPNKKNQKRSMAQSSKPKMGMTNKPAQKSTLRKIVDNKYAKTYAKTVKRTVNPLGTILSGEKAIRKQIFGPFNQGVKNDLLKSRNNIKEGSAGGRASGQRKKNVNKRIR